MNTVKKNIIYNSLYQILIYIIPLITTPYISRVLGAEKIGVYSYANSIAYYFAMFIILGLNNYGNRTIAKVNNDKDQLSDAFINIYSMQFIVGVIVLFIYIFYVIFISSNKLMAAIFIIYIISSLIDINWFYFGMEQFKLTVMRNTFIKLATTVSLFLFVKTKTDIYLYALILCLGSLFSQIFLWSQISKFIILKKPTARKIISHIKPNFILFIPVIAISLYKIMDKIMLGILANKTEVGYYESSERLINIPIGLITALGTVMLPRITNLMANNENEQAKKYLNISLEFALAVSSALSFGIMAVSDIFVPIFYGTGFEKCVTLFCILMPSTIFLAAANVLRTQFLIPKLKDKIYIISVFTGAFVNLIINVMLIPQYYSIGAAFGTLFAEASVCIYQFYKTRMEVSYSKGLKRGFMYVLIGAFMFLMVKSIDFKINSYLLLCIKVLVGGIFYIVGIIIINMKKIRRFFKQ
ncbi:flippase [Faecalibacillus intestinalis]|uniref:flippase n=1 Tax=Faecalibacillus intestinalis TaxID=1982626 RepID=UPI0022E8FF89|nr:flippase [Faecalibacillus intestinalis]